MLYGRIDMVPFVPEAFMAASPSVRMHPVIRVRLFLYRLGSSFYGYMRQGFEIIWNMSSNLERRWSDR